MSRKRIGVVMERRMRSLLVSFTGIAVTAAGERSSEI